LWEFYQIYNFGVVGDKVTDASDLENIEYNLRLEMKFYCDKSLKEE